MNWTRQKPASACQWFLRCYNAATTTVPHPILGNVPCCAKCAAFATEPVGPKVKHEPQT